MCEICMSIITKIEREENMIFWWEKGNVIK